MSNKTSETGQHRLETELRDIEQRFSRMKQLRGELFDAEYKFEQLNDLVTKAATNASDHRKKLANLQGDLADARQKKPTSSWARFIKGSETEDQIKSLEEAKSRQLVASQTADDKLLLATERLQEANQKLDKLRQESAAIKYTNVDEMAKRRQRLIDQLGHEVQRGNITQTQREKFLKRIRDISEFITFSSPPEL